jgi:hypothetical protein
MAKNADLITKILEINPEADTVGLTNKQLTETLNLLKGGDSVPDVPPEAAPKPSEAPKEYKVTDGTAITSLRGVLDCGESVKASDFPGGEATFASLKKSGAIV